MELGNIRTGERKISKKGNIAMPLPIAMAFTPMEKAALLQAPHQALRVSWAEPRLGYEKFLRHKNLIFFQKGTPLLPNMNLI